MSKRNNIQRYKYIPKYLTWKSIRPGNELSTDQC